jgi:hypothetical protein
LSLGAYVFVRETLFGLAVKVVRNFLRREERFVARWPTREVAGLGAIQTNSLQTRRGDEDCEMCLIGDGGERCGVDRMCGGA